MSSHRMTVFCLWLSILATSILGGILSEARSAHAAVFTVTKETDSNDGACNADCSLREAVIAANDAPGADTITLPAGKYQLSIAGSGENNGAQGDLDVRFGPLTINGAGAGTTEIGVTGGDDRVLEVRNEMTTVSGVTITLGQGGPGFAGGNGGGILVSGGSALTLNNVAVVGNTAEGEGGGIYVDGEASLTLNNSRVNDNVAGESGGGIANYSVVTLAGSEVADNVSGSSSGAVFNSGTLTITNSTVSGNTAACEGGAIRNNDTLTIEGSTLSGNTAGCESGAIENQGPLLMTNSTISGNTAGEEGGGIANILGMTLTNVTISGNTAASGGGLVHDSFQGQGSAHLTNVIIAGNIPDDCAHFQPITSSSHSLDSDGTCGLNGPEDLPGTNPLLGPLASNGGPTQTHATLPGSPAIDAGDDADCPATDQRGIPRPQGDGCDIGAFEFEPVTRWGDNDCSGAVDSVDALKTLRHVAALAVSQSELCPDFGEDVDVIGGSVHPWGDVDCNGGVNSVDALKVLRYVAALPVQQTQPCPAIDSEVDLAG